MQVRQNLKLSPCSAPSASCRALGRRTAQLFLQSAQFAFLLGRPGRGSELWGHQSQLQPPALPASPPPPPSSLLLPLPFPAAGANSRPFMPRWDSTAPGAWVVEGTCCSRGAMPTAGRSRSYCCACNSNRVFMVPPGFRCCGLCQCLDGHLSCFPMDSIFLLPISRALQSHSNSQEMQQDPHPAPKVVPLGHPKETPSGHFKDHHGDTPRGHHRDAPRRHHRDIPRDHHWDAPRRHHWDAPRVNTHSHRGDSGPGGPSCSFSVFCLN